MANSGSSNQTVVNVTADATDYSAELARAGTSAEKFAVANERASARTASAQAAIAEATTNGNTKSTRAVNNFIKSLENQAATAGKSRAEMLSLQAAQLGVSDAAAKYIKQIDEASQHTHSFSLNNAASKRELVVLGHELSQGNYKNFAGSMMVLAENSGFAGVAFSAAGAGALVLAAGVAGAAYEVLKGATSFAELNKQANLTNGYLGVTTGQLKAMAAAAVTPGAGLVDTQEAMVSLVGSGKLAADQIQLATQVTVEFAKDTGQEIDKAAESLVKFAEDPQAALAALQGQYHTFSAAQVEVIQHYIDIGDKASAYTEILKGMDEAHARFKTAGEQNVGYVTQLWEGLKRAVTNVKNAIASVGVETTDQDKLTAALKRQASLQQAVAQIGTNGRDIYGYKSSLDDANKQVAAIQKVVDAENKAAATTKARAEGGDALVSIDKYNRDTKYASPLDKKNLEVRGENQSFGDLTKSYQDARADLIANSPYDTASLNKLATAYEAATLRHNANLKQISDQYAKSQHTNEDPLKTQMDALSKQLSARETLLQTDLAHTKSLRAQGVIDAEEMIAREHDQRATAYQDELKYANQEISLAEHRKSKTALADWQAKKASIQALILKNDSETTDAQNELRAKETAAAKAYNDALTTALTVRAQEISTQMQGKTLGATDADDLARATAAMKDYSEKYSSLVKSLTENKISADQFNLEVTALQNYTKQRLEIESEATAQIKAMNSDAYAGIQKAAADYAEDAQNKFQLVGNVANDAAHGMEDAWVSFVTTGKLSFSSLAQSVIADIARMQAKAAVSGLFNFAVSAVTSYLGASGTTSAGGLGLGTSAASDVSSSTSYTQSVSPYSFHLASGGAVSGPGTRTSDSIPAMLSDGEFVVNADAVSRNRSLLEMINSGRHVNSLARYATGGYVGPNASSVGAGGGDIHVSAPVTVQGGSDDQANKANAAQLGKLMNSTIQSVLAKEMQQGGLIWKMNMGQR